MSATGFRDEGYLKKEGGKRKTWKKRYVRIRDGHLQYFKEQTSSEPKGTIDLSAAGNIEVLQNEGDGTGRPGVTRDPRHKNRKFLFCVEVPGRTYFFDAPSEAAMINWVHCLSKVRDSLQGRAVTFPKRADDAGAAGAPANRDNINLGTTPGRPQSTVPVSSVVKDRDPSPRAASVMMPSSPRGEPRSQNPDSQPVSTAPVTANYYNTSVPPPSNYGAAVPPLATQQQQQQHIPSQVAERGLAVGVRVNCNDGKENIGNGTIRFMGPLPNRNGYYMGVELEAPTGRNSGEYMNAQIFACKPQHGVFTRAEFCYPLPPLSPRTGPVVISPRVADPAPPAGSDPKLPAAPDDAFDALADLDDLNSGLKNKEPTSPRGVDTTMPLSPRLLVPAPDSANTSPRDGVVVPAPVLSSPRDPLVPPPAAAQPPGQADDAAAAAAAAAARDEELRRQQEHAQQQALLAKQQQTLVEQQQQLALLQQQQAQLLAQQQQMAALEAEAARRAEEQRRADELKRSQEAAAAVKPLALGTTGAPAAAGSPRSGTGETDLPPSRAPYEIQVPVTSNVAPAAVTETCGSLAPGVSPVGKYPLREWTPEQLQAELAKHDFAAAAAAKLATISPSAIASSSPSALMGIMGSNSESRRVYALLVKWR